MPRPPKLANQRVGAYTKEFKELQKAMLPVCETQNFEPPAILTEAEREVWEWLAHIFRSTYNCPVSDADRDLMVLYCRAKVATDEADAELKKDNRPYIIVPLGKDKDGTLKTTAKPNPNIKKRHDNAALCLKFVDQLGLSPLARARAGVKACNAKIEEDVFKKFMERNDD